MTPLLIAFIQEILIPEIAVAIRAHHAATGQIPTAADIAAALGLDADHGMAIGTAWLASHPGTPPLTP